MIAKNPKISRKLIKAAVVIALTGFALFWSLPILAQQQSDWGVERVERVDPERVFFRDEIPIDSLEVAIARQKHIWRFLSDKKMKEPYLKTARQTFSRKDLTDSYDLLLALLKSTQNPRVINQAIAKNFHVFRMRGKDNDGRVLLTAYFAPTLRASLHPTREFSYPLFRRPKDLVSVDLSAFDASGDESNLKRLTGRFDGKKITPYFTREEIDYAENPSSRLKPLAYVASDMDRFFLQVQGSGTLILPNGERFPVAYDGQNGHAYIGIGGEMVKDGLMTRQEQSMQMIRLLLDDDADLRREYATRNPSYVFFRRGQDHPQGSSGAFLTPRRSVATDTRLFPKGGLIFLRHRFPTQSHPGGKKVWVDHTTFAIDQDTGGAIKGPGRLDYFLGEGPWAAQTAGEFAHYGEVYYLVRK